MKTNLNLNNLAGVFLVTDFVTERAIVIDIELGTVYAIMYVFELTTDDAVIFRTGFGLS